MHVMILIGSLGRGGAERTVSTLSHGLLELGHRVTVATFAKTEVDAYPLDQAVERRVLGLMGTSSTALKPINTVRRIARVRGAIRESGSDVVVAFQTQESLMLILASIGLRCGTVVSERNAFWLKRRTWFWRTLFRWIYKYSDAQVVQTQEIAARVVRETGAGNVRIIPNALPLQLDGLGNRLDPSDVLSGDAKVFLLVGSKPHQKGFDIALRAFEIFLDGRPTGDWRLVLVGLQPAHRFVAEQVAGHRYATRILVLGPVGNIGVWYKRAFAFLLPSRAEGMPNALLEAMSSGTPCIAADCPTGPGDLIDHGENGLLVPVEEPDALAAAMKRLVQQPKLRTQLGASAEEHRVRYDREKIIKDWEQLLKSCAT